jgi:hypothetical protein
MSIHDRLLSDIEEFLTETGMGPSYFGKRAAGNSELVERLRAGGRVWPDTEERVREFMRAFRLKPREAAE